MRRWRSCGRYAPKLATLNERARAEQAVQREAEQRAQPNFDGAFVWEHIARRVSGQESRQFHERQQSGDGNARRWPFI